MENHKNHVSVISLEQRIVLGEADRSTKPYDFIEWNREQKQRKREAHETLLNFIGENKEKIVKLINHKNEKETLKLTLETFTEITLGWDVEDDSLINLVKKNKINEFVTLVFKY